MSMLYASFSSNSITLSFFWFSLGLTVIDLSPPSSTFCLLMYIEMPKRGPIGQTTAAGKKKKVCSTLEELDVVCLEDLVDGVDNFCALCCTVTERIASQITFLPGLIRRRAASPAS